MEVQLTPDLQAKLARLAAEQGRAAESIVVEAVEKMLNYDDWFRREVEVGIAAAERGELHKHDEIRRLIDQRYPG